MTVSIPHDISIAASSDELSHSINYVDVCNTVVGAFKGDLARFTNLENLADSVLQCIDVRHFIIKEMEVQVYRVMHDVLYEVKHRRGETNSATRRYTFPTLVINTIVGVNPSERIKKQPVVINSFLDKKGEEPFQYDVLLERLRSENVSGSVFGHVSENY